MGDEPDQSTKSNMQPSPASKPDARGSDSATLPTSAEHSFVPGVLVATPAGASVVVRFIAPRICDDGQIRAIGEHLGELANVYCNFVLEFSFVIM
jgi:hypothetical protein